MNIYTMIAILGAPDPEMQAIEDLLTQHGIPVLHALDVTGCRVHPGSAYATTAPAGIPAKAKEWLVVECDGPAIDARREAGHTVITVDHHRPGDPGYGRPPAEYLSASSLGQVISLLARKGLLKWPLEYDGAFPGDPGEFMLYQGTRNAGYVAGVNAPASEGWAFAYVPHTLLFVAAADHCLSAAYRGECPGVNSAALMQWRTESRAAFQRRPVADVLADIEAAREHIFRAPSFLNGVRDLRGPFIIPELPEAAAREGVAVLAGPFQDRDGRRKVVLQGANPDIIEAWLAGRFGPEDVIDRYGDPQRGFAGGYLAEAP